MFRLISISFLSLAVNIALAQKKSDKDLGTIYLDNTGPDSVRVDAAILIADNIFYSDIDTTKVLIEQAKEWSIRSNYKFGLARVNGYLGYIYHVKGDYVNAIDYYTTSIKYNVENGFDLERAMDLGNYGSLLNEFRDPKALDCYKKSIKIYEEYNKPNDLVYLYIHVSDYYLTEGEIDSSLIYIKKADELCDEKYAKMIVQTGLAQVYANIPDLDSVVHYSRLFYPTAVEFGDSSLIRTYFQNMMNVKYEHGELDSAIFYGEKAEQVTGKLIHLLKDDFYYTMSRIHEKKGNFYAAYKMMDSAFSYSSYKHDKELTDAAFRGLLNVEFHEKHLADSLNYLRDQELKEAEYKKDLEAEAQLRYGLFVGIGLVTLLVLIVYLGYSRKKRDNEIISHQKRLVDEKNKEVRDSILYAKRIQTAILPSKKVIQQLLPNSFILYLPKDIVSGDFYWVEETDEGLFFAVADCTGHGVPGALVSVICNNALNRAVREYGLRKPGEVLDKVKSIITAEFEKSDDEVYDGMDIALCKLKGDKLEFSGAHNPLWIIRDGEFIEMRADRQSVGKYPFSKDFTTHEFQIKKNDLLYIFSDGFADQFGGEKRKKFKSTALKELFLEIYQLPLDEQKQKMLNTFNNWKRDYDQIDDICALGLKLK